jgi:hypothetical protein
MDKLSLIASIFSLIVWVLLVQMAPRAVLIWAKRKSNHLS